MEAPNDNSIRHGAIKFTLGPGDLISDPFSLNTRSLLSGNKQSNSRLAMQILKSVPGGTLPVVELQARIPTVGGIMGWSGIQAIVGGDYGLLWQGEVSFSLQYRLVMRDTDAAQSIVILQVN